jgi:putative endonuclease
MNYFVYIVECSDATLYTGITTEVSRRLDEHNGLTEKEFGAKYTRVRRPVKLVYQAMFPNRSEAMKEEMRIKRMKRSEKEKLVKAYKTLSSRT